MPSIFELSVELVEQILGYLDQPALYALSRVSKNLYHMAIPYLYKHLDLLIPPGDHIPRIDQLLINLLERPHLANTVRTLCVGLSPRDGVLEGQRFLPGKSGNRHSLLDKQMKALLANEPLVSHGEDLQEALFYGDYGAYAAMLIMVLPLLVRLEISDSPNETLRPLLRLLERLHRNGDDGLPSTSPLVRHIRSIEEVTFNYDSKAGNRQVENVQIFKIWLVWKFQNLRTLEFRIPSGADRARLWGAGFPPPSFDPIPITKLIIRYSGPVLSYLQALLPATPRLRSLVCELWHDASTDAIEMRDSWLPLDVWNTCLDHVHGTLETLVISVEFCDSEQPFFKQPNGLHMTGSLDLRTFNKLRTLEVPVPFISGDPHFLIMTPIESRLPLSLRSLSLRSDMSHAQFPYPFDPSILPTTPSHQDARDERNWLQNARMDVSYIASASLSLVDQLGHLKSISIWQPPDSSLEWFESQLEDLATTCRNNGVTAKTLHPMLMRWKSAAHWDLIKEITLVDPAYPERGIQKELLRGEREGVPLGLASQYHLSEFQRRHVRRSRR
ncbi:hypothetical protein DM02DRAFT_8635 [Periconia macrospinosa]|uniref:F-box domain-containing protein n=1 Tax=Periconia macrospinosa TaxID=97972 RepID=A0A2V1EEP5_9PLEO|nr:hypothetical protein DM02DRAFT_8635 [Periconia macrospinosa]